MHADFSKVCAWVLLGLFFMVFNFYQLDLHNETKHKLVL
jgi:hypothetical protein